MIMHHAPSRRKRAALPLGELPLFRWAATRSSPTDSLAVIILAHRFRLPVPLARAVAENAGFPMEAGHE
jgi:hypothetical protein